MAIHNRLPFIKLTYNNSIHDDHEHDRTAEIQKTKTEANENGRAKRHLPVAKPLADGATEKQHGVVGDAMSVENI